MKDRLIDDETDPAITVEWADSVVKPLMAVISELSEVRKGLSKTQKAFESLTYQAATVKEQLESESKTLAKERAALEVLGKKFIANLADLENLSKKLPQEVRSGIRNAIIGKNIKHPMQ